MPGKDQSTAQDLTNTLVGILETLYSENHYHLDNTRKALLRILNQEVPTHASLAVLMNEHSVEFIEAHAKQILDLWQQSLQQSTNQLRAHILDALVCANDNLDLLIKLVNTLEPEWQQKPQQTLDAFFQDNEIKQTKQYELLAQQLPKLFSLTQHYPFKEYNRSFEALKMHILEQLVTLEAKSNPKVYVPKTEQWLLHFFELNFTATMMVLVAYQDNPITVKIMDVILTLAKRHQDITDSVKQLAKDLKYCFPKHPQMIAKVTSCFDPANDRAYHALEKSHFTSNAYPDIKNVYKKFYDLYINWKELYRDLGVKADDAFRELLNLLNPTKLPKSTFEPPKDDWSNLDAQDIDLTPYSLNDLRAEHGRYIGALFFGKDIISSNFDHGDFTNANFIHTRIGNRDNDEQFTSFRHCTLCNSQWQGAQLYSAIYDHSNLCGANFKGISTKDTSFDHITVDDKTSFENANLTGASFKNVTKNGELLSNEEVKQWLQQQKAYGFFTIDDISTQLEQVTLRPMQRRLSVRERSQKFEKQILATRADEPAGDESASTPAARPNALTPQLSRRRVATLGKPPRPEPDSAPESNSTASAEPKPSGLLPMLKSVFSHDDLDWHSKKIKQSFLAENYIHANDEIVKQYQQCRTYLLVAQNGIKAAKQEKLNKKFTTCMTKPSIKECIDLEKNIRLHCDNETQQAFAEFRKAYEEFVRLHKAHEKAQKDNKGFNMPLSPRKRSATMK